MRFENACPNCGGDLYGLTGEYDVVNGVARFIEGPAESEEQFRRFLELVDQAIADQLTAEEFVQSVHQEAPEFSSLLQMDFNRLMDILGLILMLLPGLLSVYLQHRGLQQDERQHEELMQQQEEHHEEMIKQAAQQANDLSENDVRQIVNRFMEEMEDSPDDDNTEGNGSTGEEPPEANNSQ
jgi:hypothetical protein